MNRIAGRTTICVLLALLLVAGFGFFIAEYIMEADTWVISSGSPHVYNAGNIGTGTVVDREGALLLDMSDDWTYASNDALRKSTLHWLGDRDGYISAPALAHYSAELAGYDMVSGLYTYGDSSGIAALSLSANAQKTALAAMGNHKGTVAVFNYKTGEILCSVTTPTYDPDDVPDIQGDTTGKYEGAYVNRFTQSVYIPGSIFKIVTLAAALESGGDFQQQTFTCTGSYSVGSDEITCERKHGTQNLQEAFRNSCNCAFAQITLQIGAEEMERYVKLFGITDSVRFDGITTASGNYQATNTADANVAWSGIGQYNDQVNPCAFLKFIGTIAAGGKGVDPYLVSHVQVGGSTTYTASTTTGNRIMSSATAKTIKEFMRSNVVEKYGDSNFNGMLVCAKTGTGEVGGDQKPNAMLAGFVQDEKYPLAFIVFVENGGYGREVCVPIASKVLDACKKAMD